MEVVVLLVVLGGVVAVAYYFAQMLGTAAADAATALGKKQEATALATRKASEREQELRAYFPPLPSREDYIARIRPYFTCQEWLADYACNVIADHVFSIAYTYERYIAGQTFNPIDYKKDIDGFDLWQRIDDGMSYIVPIANAYNALPTNLQPGGSCQLVDYVPSAIRPWYEKMAVSSLWVAPLYTLAVTPELPAHLRNQGHYLLAGPGHGKTQTLQHLIVKDVRDGHTVIVMDSQGEMIPKLFLADLCPPERIVYIDPRDMAAPLALNLFDLGRQRRNRYSPQMQEQLLNRSVALIKYILAALLGSDLTSKQETPFNFAITLLQHIPQGNIYTFHELMTKGAGAYEQHFHKLSPITRRFFEDMQTGFHSREYRDTRNEIARRVYDILRIPTFERMFSATDTKLDMLAEMNAGKVVLINTSQAFLGRDASNTLARFFLALTQQAIEEREVKGKRVYLYLDEAGDYLDKSVEFLIDQGRKREIGVIASHQRMNQLDDGVLDALMGCSIKMVGGVKHVDANRIAKDMQTDAATILAQPDGTFWCSVKGHGAFPLSYPRGTLEAIPQRSRDEAMAMLMAMRHRYATWQPEYRQQEEPTYEAHRRDPKTGKSPHDLTRIGHDKDSHWDTF